MLDTPYTAAEKMGKIMQRSRILLATAWPLAAMPCASAVAVLAYLTGCASPVAVGRADNSPPPKSAVVDPASAKSAGKPMIIRNADGTITVHKEPSNGDTDDTKIKNGLAIPAQVITPIVPVPDEKQ